VHTGNSRCGTVVACVEHTASCDSAHSGKKFIAATSHVKQCAPSRQLNNPATKVASAHEVLLPSFCHVSLPPFAGHANTQLQFTKL
jgi:hypothetical protein